MVRRRARQLARGWFAAAAAFFGDGCFERDAGKSSHAAGSVSRRVRSTLEFVLRLNRGLRKITGQKRARGIRMSIRVAVNLSQMRGDCPHERLELLVRAALDEFAPCIVVTERPGLDHRQ
jgi:hypothetical protein